MTDVASMFASRRRYTKHGLSKHPLYQVWYNMMSRCYDSRCDRFDRYGARGIEVCERWHDVRAFVEDMEGSYQPGLSLGRVDNDKGYSPENCHWETPREQANNRSSNVMFGGSSLAQLARALNIGYPTMHARLSRGWPLHRAVRPVRPYTKPASVEGDAHA